MALSDQELKEIAYLARINVSEDSLSSLKKELEGGQCRYKVSRFKMAPK